MKKNNCYCQSDKSYKECCQPFLSGTSFPHTPEQLMRSRFSAFCTKNIEYLVATHHPSMRQPDEADALLKTINQTQWLGLKILKAKKIKPDQTKAYVEFVAFYKTDKIDQLHENSRFILENDQWYYLDGQILEPLKFSRNEPCWCGSKKKYKKCHGKS
ncbi:MAG: YchJ family protein [Desulfobacteraceae bacterium]|nr:YchJ family protein [Desulfobacteraceae bacterium]